MLNKKKFELSLNEKFHIEISEDGVVEEFIVIATGGFNDEDTVDCVVLENQDKSQVLTIRKIYETLD